MVLSETKSALVIKFLNFIAYLQSEILIFLVFVSSGDVTFFSGDITKISGNMTQVLGDMASGEMTLGRLDRLPAWIHREGTPLNSSFETHERETL